MENKIDSLALTSDKTEKNTIDKKVNKVKSDEVSFEAFNELATLLNTSLENVKDECCLFQIKKIMSYLGKVIVRYNVSDKELERIISNSALLSSAEILVSPAYLPAVIRQTKKLNQTSLKVSSIIDFPFGESLYKSKISDIRDSIKAGAVGVTVMMPQMLLEPENIKTFKKQVRKLGYIRKIEKGVAFSVMDLSESQIKVALKLIEKTKLDFVTFVFGEVTFNELKEKMSIINQARGKKKIRVLANVESVSSVKELIALNVDEILSPFSDEIGKELIERFKIKSVKLK